jgi:hypothetical protein
VEIVLAGGKADSYQIDLTRYALLRTRLDEVNLFSHCGAFDVLGLLHCILHQAEIAANLLPCVLRASGLETTQSAHSPPVFRIKPQSGLANCLTEIGKGKDVAAPDALSQTIRYGFREWAADAKVSPKPTAISA